MWVLIVWHTYTLYQMGAWSKCTIRKNICEKLQPRQTFDRSQQMKQLTPRCTYQVDFWGFIVQFNTLRSRQNGRHFADYIFKRIILNENIWISIKISLKFVPKGPINNIPSLVQIMAWRRPGDKPLSEPMMARLPTHICVTRPQWVNHERILNWIACIETMTTYPRWPFYGHIEVWWRIYTYASVNGSGNGHSPVRCQTVA